MTTRTHRTRLRRGALVAALAVGFVVAGASAPANAGELEYKNGIASISTNYTSGLGNVAGGTAVEGASETTATIRTRTGPSGTVLYASAGLFHAQITHARLSMVVSQCRYDGGQGTSTPMSCKYAY